MRKKWKKILCVVLTCCMMVSALAGCGGSSSSGSSSDASGESDEIVEITCLFPILGSAPADLEMVEEAVNEITEAEIGVHVTFLTVSLSEAQSEVTRMVAAGEQVDVLPVLSTYSYVNSGLLEPLDDLLEEYGQDITENLGVILEASAYQGNIYSLYSNTSYAQEYGAVFRKDILDKYGLSLEEGEVLDYETLDSWFEIIKEGEGEAFYMNSMVGTGTETTLQSFCLVDQLGGSYYTGVFTDYDTDDYTIQNFFETDVFEEYMYWMNKWYEAGYINPDSATMSDSSNDLMLSGNYLGYFGGAGIGKAEENTASLDYEMVTYTFYDTASILAQNYSTGWAISSSSEYKEASMKFLNLTWSNEELVNLMTWGIEGVHYELTDEEGIIDYVEGADSTSVSYAMPGATWVGNTDLAYRMYPTTSEIKEELSEFNEGIAAGSDEYNISKAFGYVFDQSPVETEIAALSDVYSEYKGVIFFGSQDPDEVIEELNEALYAAGLSTVLEENQRQLDEWLAAQ